MMLAPTFFGLLAFCTAALACPGEEGHDHVHKREFPQAPLTPPTKPLQWGDVNVIHTTDSHGWLLGHQKSSFPEPNYRYRLLCAGKRNPHSRRVLVSGDFGDFSSFVEHMKQIALVRFSFLY